MTSSTFARVSESTMWPSSSTTSEAMGSEYGGSAVAQADRHVPDAGMAIAARPLDGRRQLIGREPPQHLLEHDAHLQAGEVGAETEVHAVAEGEVRVGVAADVEVHRPGKHRLVAVRRGLPEQDLVARLDRVTAERRLASGRSTLRRRRGSPTQHLFHGRGKEA